MYRLVRCAARSAAARAPSALVAQTRSVSPITTAEIDGYLRFLSSDLLEGRAPGTRGGRLAAEYIADQLRAFGVEPGVNGSYFQPVPIDVLTTQPSSRPRHPPRARRRRRCAQGRTSCSRRGARRRSPRRTASWCSSATAPSRPSTGGTTSRASDLKGKILLVLVNDPPAPAAEPTLFGGIAMTYYGRWTYKYEEAERRGAAGVLIVHRTDQAGYPFQVLVGSNSTGQRLLPRDPKLPPPLGVRGWITDSAATALLRQAGLDMAALRAQAATRDFRPVATGITMDLGAREHGAARDVGERRRRGARPRSAARASSTSRSSAHWDHLGIGTPVNGDSIYNGAFDNASGVASVLAIARARRGAADAEAVAALRLRDGGGVRAARLGVLRAEPDRAAVADRREPQRGRDELPSAARAISSRSARTRAHSVRSSRRCCARRGCISRRRRIPRRGTSIAPITSRSRRRACRRCRSRQGLDFVGRPKEWGLQQVDDYDGAPLPPAVGRVSPRLRSERRGAADRYHLSLRAPDRRRADAADVERRRGVPPLRAAAAVTRRRGRPRERRGERGLVRVIGTWGLAAGIVNVTVGGGIFRLPAGVAAALGTAAPLAYLACTLAMGLIVLCFAEAGSRVSMTGGPYAYVETAFGPFVGFVCRRAAVGRRSRWRCPRCRPSSPTRCSRSCRRSARRGDASRSSSCSSCWRRRTCAAWAA